MYNAELFANRMTEHEETFWLTFVEAVQRKTRCIFHRTILINHQVFSRRQAQMSPQMSELPRHALNSRLIRCYYKSGAITASDIITVCQHVWGTLVSLSRDLCDLCADNILIVRSECTVDSGWQWIMRVFYVGWSCEPHQRRLEGREEPPWIKPAAEQRVKYLEKRPGRIKGRLCIRSAALSAVRL